MFSEPSRTAYDLNFALFGIPVRVHPLFWLATVVLGANGGGGGIGILTWMAAMFFSILVHELGHAWIMRLHGFHPSIVLYGMGGLTSYGSRGSFSSTRRGMYDEVLICAAGPLAGFLLAAVLVAILFAAGKRSDMTWEAPWGLQPYVLLTNTRLAALLNDVFRICVIWGLVNLLPVYPLDGGQIARELLVQLSPRDGIRQSMIVSIFAAVAMAVYGYSRMGSLLTALFFGYLAYGSYVALQNYTHGSRW